MYLTCHYVFSSKINSPPRILFFVGVSTRLVIILTRIIFIDSSATESIVGSTGLFCFLFESKI